MEKDKISVIIPTYNRANCIKKSVESILNQTYKNLEVIIVDDCSTDDTEKIVKKIKDSRLKYIKLTKNSGACHARNKGIKTATGKYIAFNDSDDIYYPDKLEKQYNNLLKNKSEMDFCKIKVIAPNIEVIYPTEEQEKNIKKGEYEKEICNGNFISTQDFIIEKKIIEKYQFDESLPRMQDYDLMLRMIPDLKLSYTNEILAELYRQDDSISNSNVKLNKAINIMSNKDYKFNKENMANLKKYFNSIKDDLSGYMEYLENVNNNINEINSNNQKYIEELKQNISELQNAINNLQNDYEELHKNNDELQKNYNLIINSKSFKLLTKIRNFTKIFRRK